MADHPTSDERWADLAAGRPLPPLDPAVAAQLQASLDAWRALHAEARRRLAYDAYLSARAKSAARLLEDDRHNHGGRWDHRDTELALTAAALAIVVTDHPELITGTAPTVRRSPRDVLASVLAPVIPLANIAPGASVERLADLLLDALTLDGYEVAPRADRFASLADDGEVRHLRIPLRGRCGHCGDGVHRDAHPGHAGELLLDRWRHVDAAVEALHEPTGVEAL